MGPDACRANKRSVLITDVHASGAGCIQKFVVYFFITNIDG